MTRYYGWYANRPRGRRRQAATETVGAPVDGAIIVAEPVSLPLREARRREGCECTWWLDSFTTWSSRAPAIPCVMGNHPPL